MTERDAGNHARRRSQQRRRAATTMSVLALMLFFAFWYAYSYYRDSARSAEQSETGCTPYNPDAPVPANTIVNVLNDSGREGLAAQTGRKLQALGFTVGTIGNDRSDRTVAAVEVRYGPAGKERAALLKAVAAVENVQPTELEDQREGSTIDLVLGQGFTILGPVPTPSGPPMCPNPSTSPTSATPATSGSPTPVPPSPASSSPAVKTPAPTLPPTPG